MIRPVCQPSSCFIPDVAMTTATPAEEAAREPSGDSRSEGAAWPSGTRVCLRSTDPLRRCDDARILRRPGNLQLARRSVETHL